MNFNHISQILVEIIGDFNIMQLLTDLGIFGIAAFFIKKLIENSAQKRLEEFKGTLAVIQNKQDLLHRKREKIIAELYSLLVALNSSMYHLTNPVKQVPEGKNYDDQIKQLTNKAYKDFYSFNKFYLHKKIYFEERTCEIIESILKLINTAIWDFNEHQLYKGMGDIQGANEARTKMLTAYHSVKDDIPKVKKELEENFREILDVINKD